MRSQKRQVLDIITLNDSVMGHKSNGLGTVVGYIELDLSSSTAGDAFVAAYDHLLMATVIILTGIE